jgi:ABC-type antimicrobial peptide transport system permease subunit
VRLVAQVITAVGVVGLGLSVLGLYAVIAYSVSQRTHEIGIRMAIGASSLQVLGMVLRQGLLLSAAGIGIGLLLTLALSSALGEMLNGVNPRDPGVYAAATAVLLAVTLFATYLPARRASRVDPQAALRADLCRVRLQPDRRHGPPEGGHYVVCRPNIERCESIRESIQCDSALR